VREALCGTTCDENEDHEDALFVLPPLLALLFAVVKKVRKVSLLIFAFVRIPVVVVAKPPLLKEVIIITEREREIIPIPKGTDKRPKRGVIPYAPKLLSSLSNVRTVVILIITHSYLSLSRL
jgi:hypothetical protein